MRPSYLPVIIPASGTTPVNWASLSGQQLVGFIIPASMTSTAITFNMSPDLNAATISSVPVAASSGSTISFTISTSAIYVGFTNDQFKQFEGVENVKIVCGSTESSARTIYLVTLPR